MIHRPSQGIDVFFGLDANGCAEAISSQHVHGRTVPGAFGNVGVDGHGVAAGLRVLQHPVNEADFSGFFGCCTKVVTEGHIHASGRRCFNVVHG